MTTPKSRPGAADHALKQQATFLEEQRQAQAHIKNKKQLGDARFHVLAAATGHYAWTTTSKGRGLDMLDWSTFTGLPLAEGQGDGWRKALHPEDSEHLFQAWLQAREERQVCVITCRMRRSGGHYHSCSLSILPLLDDHERVAEWIWSARDLDEQLSTQRAAPAVTVSRIAGADLLPAAIVEVLLTNRGVAATVSFKAGDVIMRQVAAMMHRALQLDFVGIATYLTAKDPLQPRAAVGSSPAQENKWWQAMAVSSLLVYVDAATAARLQGGEICQLSPLWSQNGTDTRRRLITPLISHGRFIGLIEVEYREPALPDVLEQRELLRLCSRLVALGIEQGMLLHEQLETRASLLALNEANQRMDEFLGIASHELRTPMTSVTLYLDRTAQLMKSRPAPDNPDIQKRDQILDKLQSMLAKAQIQMKRQHRLVNDLLDFSRIHKTWLNLQMSPCSLTSLVLEAIEEERLLNPARTIQLRSKAKDIKVIADADRLRQVVSNYLSNALKYSPGDKAVRVVIQEETDTARVLVEDQGSGLTPDEQQHIWEQFYRAPQAQRQNRGGVGLGLGLHICRAIIEQHRGQVGVSSLAGAGSTFWFTLPIAQPE